MSQPLREALALLRAAPGFVTVVLVTLTAAAFIGLMVTLMMLEVDLPGAFGQMTHFQEPHHRIHDIAFGLLFMPAVVGLVAQLRRPANNVAGMLMAFVPIAALLLTLLLTVVVAGDARVLQPPWVIVAAGVVLAMSLHPAGSGFFRSFAIRRISWPMLALLAVAAVPLVAAAVSDIGLQATVADDHSAAGHYGFMAAFAITVTGTAGLASLGPDGSRLTAWIAGLLPPLHGLSSLAYPDATSALSLVWSLAAIAWGTVFVATAELTRNPTPPTPAGQPTVPS